MHVYLSDVDKYANYSFKFFYCNGQNSLKTGTVLASIRAPGDPEMNSARQKNCIYILDLTTSLFSVVGRHIVITKD